jgi:predicted nucleic acid-binding protein
MNYLLDTNVVSELSKPSPHPDVLSWCTAPEHRANAYLSALTLGEIRKGIEHKRRQHPQRAAVLEAVLATLQVEYSDRVLAIDPPVADV